MRADTFDLPDNHAFSLYLLQQDFSDQIERIEVNKNGRKPYRYWSYVADQASK